jgi:hypothetical protein
VLPLERGYNQVLASDLNGDHLPDLVFSDQNGIAIIHNAGNRTFSAETHYLAGTVGNIVVRDFNGDGFPDIAVASSGATVAVLLNQPQGNLTTGKLTIQPEPSTVTKPFSMTLELAPFKVGSGTPTGTVTFSIDGNPVGTVPLSGTGATFPYQSSSLALGFHAIAAVYNGDANFVPAYFSASLQVIPIIYPTSITLTAKPNPVLASQTVSFHATVSSPGQTPYGTVSFVDGTTLLGAVTLDRSSLAVFDTALLAAGKHVVTAHYLGNADFAPVTSLAVNVVVNINSTSTTLVANPTAVSVGGAVLLTARVTAPTGTATGSVVFYDGGTLLQTVALGADGVAVCGSTFSTAGTHVVTATYVANGTFASSASSAVDITVTALGSTNGTSTSLSASVNSQVDRGLTLTAHVSARKGSPSGTVAFLDGASRLGEVALDENGTAVYRTASFLGGLHYVSAFYPGNSALGPSVSQVLTETLPLDVADFAISLFPPNGVTLVTRSTNARVRVTSINGFSEGVTLSCATGTPYLTCGFRSPHILRGNGTSALTIAMADVGNGGLPQNSSSLLPLMGVFAAPFLCLGIARKRSRCLGMLCVVTLSSAAALMSGCGSPTLSSAKVPSGTYTVTVTGTSQQTNSAVIHTIALPVHIPVS